MEKQKAMLKPPMVERRIGGSLWVYESNSEKQFVEAMLNEEQRKHPNESVSIRRVFTNEKHQRAVEFGYSKRSKPINPELERLAKKIWEIKFYVLRQDVKRSLRKK